MDSNTDNPLFHDRKELLERQSQEYKHALMGEVQVLKHKSQDVGKKVLLAGGALVLTYALAKALQSRSKSSSPNQQKLLVYKGKKNKKKKLNEPYALYEDLTTRTASAFDVSDAHYSDLAESAQQSTHATAQPAQTTVKVEQKESLAKDIMGIVGRHLTAYLVILGTRKLEEYLNARQHDADTPSTETASQQFGDTYVSPGAANIQSALAE